MLELVPMCFGCTCVCMLCYLLGYYRGVNAAELDLSSEHRGDLLDEINWLRGRDFWRELDPESQPPPPVVPAIGVKPETQQQISSIEKKIEENAATIQSLIDLVKPKPKPDPAPIVTPDQSLLDKLKQLQDQLRRGLFQ